MKNAYLECEIKEGEEFFDEVIVTITLANGTRDSGAMNKKFFNEKGQLKVSVVEENGKNTIIILPTKLSNEEYITVDSNQIIN